MSVVVDAMGGDKAPKEIVKGAIKASLEYGANVILVGQEERINPLLKGKEGDGIEVVHAEAVIGMNEHPAKSLRRKPDSSIARAAGIARDKKAALLSAGNTGAVMAATLLSWGRVPGIERPGIACVIPTQKRNVTVLDVGANVDCKPSHILQFAIMGSLYANQVLKVDNPSVALLNIGEEDKKGNEQTLATYKVLEGCKIIDFYGNIEPEGLYKGQADVVVTDGFAGNIFLKASEAVSNLFIDLLQKAFSREQTDGKTIDGVFKSIFEYSTRNPRFAGAPLLGVNGTCIIAHGGAEAETIAHCVDLANRFAESGTLQSIRENATQ